LRKRKMEIRDKRVTVVGLARSGVGAANLLAECGAVVTVTDIKPQAELSGQIRRLAPSIRLALGEHPAGIFTSADLVVVSPGVPLEIRPIADARAKGVPVIGELELAWRMTGDREAGRGIPFLAVTGSNGKSTTTALLDHMVRKAGFHSILGGNIGNALTEEIIQRARQGAEGGAPEEDFARFTLNPSADFVVAEVSSFQLEAISAFRPHVATVLNITPDHMDRYHSFNEYAGAKARIFENQRDRDFLVLNADDPETAAIAEERLRGRTGGPTVFYFSRIRKVQGVHCIGENVVCNFPHIAGLAPGATLISAAQIAIRGVHNLENAMAASAMALLAGCPAGAVIESLKEFAGLEHRLEYVRTLEGVRYFNDSKGTNVGAVLKSVESFSEPLILIAGGRDKAGDFVQLADLVSRKVKTLVLIGEAAGKIKAALGSRTETVMARDLDEAVTVSRGKAHPGDVVLLSPACASFDMFRDFEDRGRKFKKIVMGLEPIG
jgi:UDP-N-acetylmuramoylalanine--D-glutamate ligase